MSDAFTTVWQPGSGTQWVRWDMSGNAFTAQNKTYFDQGLRVTSLSIKNGRLAAVWRPGSGVQWVRWSMSSDDFKAQDKTYLAQGLRITELAVDNGKLAAVWRPGSGAQWGHWSMSGEEFKAQDKTYFAQGLRITSLAVDNGELAAVWRPGSGAQWVRWDMSDNDLAAQDRIYFPQGLRITSLASENGRYAAVWQPGSGTQWWSARRSVVDFSTEAAAYFQGGLRIACFDLQDDPVGAYRYPWRGGVSFNVGQANNNPAGSHNGSQAFAYDFSLPAGTQIRAARAGTVEWLQENLTATFNANQPNGPGNMPFPAGSLQNWGNAVRLRHAGGFTSWYFHIRANGVLVNVGDVVAQGQAIAISGNTGRSSGPHLHFQVQADSADWGQSVACTFGDDCEQPAAGDSATSDNAP
jgi:murein DD-endopeptidase MepM/ murein hydrolase activator NlpD